MARTGRKPGTPKTGGRQPGSQNKISGGLKQWLSTIIEDNKPQFEANIKSLEPERHVQIIEKLLAFVVSKPQNLDVQIEYRELERLLERTPTEYIEKITARLIELNSINTNSHEDTTEEDE
jgi:hypothetical protein